MTTPDVTLLEDLCTRFILTAPSEELMNFNNMMFLVEQAHWYYEDNVRERQPHLRSYPLEEFAKLIFDSCLSLKDYAGDVSTIMAKFREFKGKVPACGAMLLDAEMQCVLLVKGYKVGSCWGFPRGKINRNETDAQCAAREVHEETGLDIDDMVVEEDYVERTLQGKRTKLFIVPGIDPETTMFAPQCRGEISGYAWHSVDRLPDSHDSNQQLFTDASGQRHKFFMVWPFIRQLREWIKVKKRHMSQTGSAPRPRPKPAATTTATVQPQPALQPSAQQTHAVISYQTLQPSTPTATAQQSPMSSQQGGQARTPGTPGASSQPAPGVVQQGVQARDTPSAAAAASPPINRPLAFDPVVGGSSAVGRRGFFGGFKFNTQEIMRCLDG